MHVATKKFGTVIIGAGPAGTAILLAACSKGRLGELLDKGLAIIEQTETFGVGQIGDYAINSDSTAATFIDCIKNSTHPALKLLQEHALTKQFAQRDQNPIPLHLVGQLSALIGEALQKIIAEHPACRVYLSSKVILARQQSKGSWCSLVQMKNGQTIELTSSHLVMATGAYQPRGRLASEVVAGENLASLCDGRLVQSGDVLRIGGLNDIADRLAGKPNAKLVIIGGSTSAVSVAHTLLTRLSPALVGAGSVSLLHRRELRIYYPSVAEALADGYTEFTAQDLCPLTGRVYRLAGLRLDSKELICQARGIGGRQADPRLRLHHLQTHDPEALRLIARADLVIACFGYRPMGLKLADKSGRLIKLLAHTAAAAPLVDEDCRVLNETRLPLQNLFAIGLASGFIPRGALGGEPSFVGQANGLWLWQTAVGGRIVDKILATPLSKPIQFADRNLRIKSTPTDTSMQISRAPQAISQALNVVGAES